MPDIKGLLKTIEKVGSCPKYQITESMLSDLNQVLLEDEETSSRTGKPIKRRGLDKKDFLEIVGIPEEDIDATLKVQTNSILYCIKKQIESNPSLKKHNVSFGVHKTNGPEDDQVVIKRLE